MKYPAEYTNPREYIIGTFNGDETVVDSANRLVVPFPDGTKELITSQSLCNGGSTTYSSSEESDGSASTDPASLATGSITSRIFIGSYLALDGINGIITAGIPRTGLVGNNPYMMFGPDGIYGKYGETDQPWFIAATSEGTYTYIDPDTLIQTSKTFQGGDFFIGNYPKAYLNWDYAAHTLTIAGDVVIQGDLESYNFAEGPPIVGYKLEWQHGNAWFGGAVIAGACKIGDGTTTAVTIGGAINSTGNFVNDVINSAINTSAKEILGDFTISDANTSDSGFKAGDIAWDGSGAPTTGSGVAMTPYGLVGANSGSVTFSISAVTGNSTFGGDLIAASGTFGTITAGSLQGSLTVGGRLATTIGGAIDSAGDFINDVINSKLDTATKEILGDFTFGVSGAIKMITDSDNGLWISPTGILGKKSGSTMFALDTLGNATFAGDITGSTITGSTITGGIVQTGEDNSGPRIILNGSTNKIEFKYNKTLYATMYPYFTPRGSGFKIATHGDYTAQASITISESITTTTACIIATNICLDGVTTNVRSLIASSSMSTPSLTLNGDTKTAWPSSAGDLSDLNIDVNKDWDGYSITNLNNLIPGTAINTDLGSITRYWSNLWIDNVYGNGVNYVKFQSAIDMKNHSITNINNLDVNGDAITHAVYPSTANVYDLGTSSLRYVNVHTRGIRFKTGATVDPGSDGEMLYYDSAGGGFRGNVNGWLGQFDMTAK